MDGVECLTFADDGTIPNSPLPLLLYRSTLPADAGGLERAFAANGWSAAWRNGIFAFHHFHSNAHEVLGIAAGTARVLFGGPAGREVAIAAGDVVVIPAGVGHCRLPGGDGLLVVGAYPGGAAYDTCRGDPACAASVRRNIAGVALPGADPVHGAGGPLLRLWRGLEPGGYSPDSSRRRRSSSSL